MAVSTNGHAPAAGVAAFLLPRTRGVLRWQDGPYGGAEVQVALRLTVAEVLRFQANQRAAGGGETPADESEPGPWEANLRAFGGRLLLGWNLARLVLDADGAPVLDADGQPCTEPIPPTLESCLSLPFQFADQMLVKYGEEVAGLPPNSSSPSSDGRLSEPDPTTTAPPTANLSNSKPQKRSRR